MDQTVGARTRRAIHAVFDPASYRVLRGLLAGRMLDVAELPAAHPVALDVPDSDGGLAIIPPIIFQTWKSREHIPGNYYYWRQTFISKCPGYRFILWDDDDNRAFITKNFPWFVAFYDRYPREIFRADIVRLFFMYTYGGIYVDMDTECLMALDDLRAEGDVVLGRMGRDENFDHSIPNAIMASKPLQAFWLVAIAMAIQALNRVDSTEKLNQSSPDELTGPVLIKNTYEFFSRSRNEEIRKFIMLNLPQADGGRAEYSQVTLLDREALYPLCWTNFVHRLLKNRIDRNHQVPDREMARQMFPRSYVVAYWTHSW